MSQRKNLSPTVKMCTSSPHLFQMVNAQVDTKWKIISLNIMEFSDALHNAPTQAIKYLFMRIYI